jgi:hypothetical protein
VAGAHKATVVRGESELPHNGCLSVSDCHEALIYVLAPLQVRPLSLNGLEEGRGFHCYPRPEAGGGGLPERAGPLRGCLSVEEALHQRARWTQAMGPSSPRMGGNIE